MYDEHCTYIINVSIYSAFKWLILNVSNDAMNKVIIFYKLYHSNPINPRSRSYIGLRLPSDPFSFAKLDIVLIKETKQKRHACLRKHANNSRTCDRWFSEFQQFLSRILAPSFIGLIRIHFSFYLIAFAEKEIETLICELQRAII